MHQSLPLWVYLALFYTVFYLYGKYSHKPLRKSRTWHDAHKVRQRCEELRARPKDKQKGNTLFESPEDLFCMAWLSAPYAHTTLTEAAFFGWYASWRKDYGHPGCLYKPFHRQQLFTNYKYSIAAATLSQLKKNLEDAHASSAPRTHSSEDQKKLYRQLSRLCHPDVAKSPRVSVLFVELNTANQRNDYQAMLVIQQKIQAL